MKWTARKTRRVALAAVAVILLCPIAALWFSRPLLCLDDGAMHADAIVVLGGDKLQRPPRALELYQAGAAPKIILSGQGDCDEFRLFLAGHGVPVQAIELECRSRNTSQNARFSIALLRAQGARRVIVVTSWFHSRRAIHCFRHYAPDLEFFSAPTLADRPVGHWPERRERSWVLEEYAKVAFYWVRYGVRP